MSEETTKISVKRITINGYKYLISNNNILYNPETKEEVGLYDEETNSIKPLPDIDDEDEYISEDEDYNEADNIYYLSEDSEFFKKETGVYNKTNNTLIYKPDIKTGIELSNSFMTQDAVVFKTGRMSGGQPVQVLENGIAYFLGGSRRGSEFWNAIKWIDSKNEVIDRKIPDDKTEIIGIYNPSKGAFAGLFGYSKGHTTLETNDKRIVDALKEYILPKILFQSLFGLREISSKPSKVTALEKGLEDASKDLASETDPKKIKVIKAIMKKLITEIPKAKEDDVRALIVKKNNEEYNENSKKRNEEILAEQKRIKKQIKDKEDEEKRLRLERNKKEREEALAKKEAERLRLEAKEQRAAKIKKYEPVYDARSKYDALIRIRGYKGDYKVWIEVKDMLEKLPVADVDWYYELKADMEKFLVDNKQSALVEALERYSEYKNQIKNPTRWAEGGDNTTKKGIGKRDAFVAEATDDKLKVEDFLKKNFTKEERDKAIETIKGKGMRRPIPPPPNNPILAVPHFWNGQEWIPIQPLPPPPPVLLEDEIIEGGKLERDELKGLLDASYDGRERVGDWVIDKQLSTNTSKVYSKGERAVVSHKGTEGISDWGNNLAFAVGGEYLYKKTDRYKEAKKVQKAAEKKYGAKNVSTIGHSQGGLQAELLGSKSKEIITLNKASHPLISRKSGNQTDIRSDRDIVSIATKTPTTEIKAESYNPLTEHSIDILDRVSKDTQYGKGINNPNLYQQVKDAADIIYEKPSAYKSGFIVKKYKELGGTYSGKKDNKGIGRWFKEEWKDVGNKEYPVFRPTKIVTKDTPLTPEEIKPSNLKKQIALKQEIKGDANLPPFEPKTGGMVVSLGQSADNISEYDEVYKYSNPKKVQEKAKKYLGEGGIIYRSISKGKKYMVYNPNTKKWVHFGALNYEDHTKHMDEKRRQSYLKRSANIKGDWKDDKYSPNNLSRNLLW